MMRRRRGGALLGLALVLAPALHTPAAEPVADPRAEAPEAELETPPADVLVARGQLSTVKQAWTQAEETFRLALEQDGARGDAWRGLGYVLRKQGRTEDALEAYEKAVEHAPQDPDALLGLGECYVTLDRRKDAEKLLERLRDLDRRHAATLHRVITTGKPR